MIFEYQALNKKGNTVSDFIDAPTEIAARQKLRNQELYVVRINRHEITEKKDGAKKISSLKKAYRDAINYISLKLSSKQIGIFSRQLATLLKAGMPLPVAITDIIDQ